MDYDFTFVVAGVSVDDQAAVDALRDKCDAVLARAGGVDLLCITGSGESGVAAAFSAVSVARDAVPQVKVLRLDRDLVGVSEIAERTGRSRQNVSQWIAGERKAQGTPFPAPEGTVGRSQVWLWSEVNQWLSLHGLDDGAAYPSRKEMAEIDVVLANSFTLSFTWAATPGFAAGRDRVLEKLKKSHLPDFARFLSRLRHTTDERGDHVLVVADQGEPACGVMERVASFSHDVVLVTDSDEQFMAVVLSTRAPSGPRNVVSVPQKATVGEWLRLAQKNPHSSFAPEASDVGQEELAPIQSFSTAA